MYADYRHGLAQYRAEEYEPAFEAMLKAATQGHPTARQYLARMYSKGQGVPKDLEKAKEWDGSPANAGGPQMTAPPTRDVDSAGFTRLHSAAERGRLDQVNQLLESGADVNAKVPDGRTAIHMAAQGGYPEVVQALLHHGADVEAIEHNGSTALHFAAVTGRPRVVELLLKSNVNLDLRSRSSATPLHSAIMGLKEFGISESNPKASPRRRLSGVPPVGTLEAYADVVSQLLAGGADVNKVWTRGVTALHQAAEIPDATLGVCLVEHGARVDAKNDLGQTPLHLAAGAGNVQLMEVLIREGADVNAVGHGSSTPLLMAVTARWAPAVEFLLAHQADLDRRDDNGRSAMHIGALMGDAEVLEAIARSGGEVNCTDSSGAMPLHYAAFMGYVATVEQLLAMGADAHAVTGNGSTALITCFPSDDDARQLETVRTAAVKRANKNGLTPDLPPADRNSAAKLLIAAGVDVNAVTSSGMTALHNAAVHGLKPAVQALLEQGADPLAKDASGFTGLHYACDRGQVEVVRLLLEGTPIPVDERENWNATSLHLASQSGYGTPAALASVAELLLTHGADINARMRGGQTPLHRAAERGRIQVAEVLLRHGADVDALSDRRATPSQVAQAAGQRRMSALLAQARRHVQPAKSEE